MTGELSGHLQKLSRLLAKVQPMKMRYQISEFVEDLRAKLEEEHPAEAKAVEWQSSISNEAFEIDPQLLQAAFLELFENAFTHDRGTGAISFFARSGSDAVEFRLSEPKQRFEHPLADWGGQPLLNIRHGHYGLGLFRVRSILEAHDGSLRAEFDPVAEVFTTTVCLPRIVS
jgi:K+-sensing histidine kinase KdpD